MMIGDHTQGSPFVVSNALHISSINKTDPVSSLHRPYTLALSSDGHVVTLTFINDQIKALILELKIQYIHFYPLHLLPTDMTFLHILNYPL